MEFVFDSTDKSHHILYTIINIVEKINSRQVVKIGKNGTLRMKILYGTAKLKLQQYLGTKTNKFNDHQYI